MKKIKEIINKFQDLDQRDLEIFISEILGKDKSFVISHWEHRLSLFHYLKLIYFIDLRKKGYSVAAIIGHKEFYGLDFFVNKKVLIPRPETELMVEEAIKEINNCHAEFISASYGILKQVQDDAILIDVGTGSGCIPISILKNIKEPIKTFAIDISKPALQVAKKNAKIHNTNINFLHGNLLKPFLSLRGVPIFRDDVAIPKLTLPNNGIASLHKVARNDTLIITANLPYITEQQYQNEPSIQQEPKNALVANNNGLALYEELLKQIRSILLIVNCSILILLEIDPSQTKTISNSIEQILPGAKIEIKKDLAGLDRLVKITRN